MDFIGLLKQEKLKTSGNMKVIVKPSSSTLCELEVTTEKAKEKELLEQR